MSDVLAPEDSGDTSKRDEAAGYRPDNPENRGLQKHLNLPVGRADVMPVEMAKWNRLKKRVEKLETRWTINWLSAGASGSASLALSALIAALTLPTGDESEIDPVVQPALFIGAAAAALLAVAFLIFFLVERKSRSRERSDIVDEMETEEDAWEQRSGEGS